MPKTFVRFPALKKRGFVTSWTQLKQRIERDGFPPGRMIGPNTRAWTEEEIDAWAESRPVAGPEPRGAAKQRRDKARAVASVGPSVARPELPAAVEPRGVTKHPRPRGSPRKADSTASPTT